MAHPLQRYLKAHDLTQEEFAKKAKIDRPTISKVLTGKRKRFSPEVAKKIVAATKREITLEEALFSTFA